MAMFWEAPAGDPKVGEKIFKTKCAQCHVANKGDDATNLICIGIKIFGGWIISQLKFFV